ncbi:oxalate/formate MFS antiporter [Pullulanibacillus sp. KACC 23026]|uniref:oxalate/formate MFS antiporter n=1 Tax=Pullulanibacillus sp. KACC 23026 TaxID=3028315 RepID=UPI0023B077CE|nr:oxalate/formate MFS antiporter [Pullulanibacillus sp. KACC 23026]WEG11196.1 oxalate/formate MFS antiporter [Pullulanibacillus sp. KACC 23026]
MTKENVKINRWWQLVFGVVVMMTISSPQYTWTLFVQPIQQHLGIGLVGIQFTFSLLIIIQTWFSPVQGYLIEKFGPRLLVSIGSILIGLSWIFTAFINNLGMLYLTYGVMGGFGTGIIYVGVIGLMVRWFPDYRGLTAGLAAAGYGFGAIFTTFPISNLIHSTGYVSALLIFGAIQGIIGFLFAQGLKTPPSQEMIKPKVVDQTHPTPMPNKMNFSPREMFQSPIFWILFIMMALMSTSGLMVTSEVSSFADDFGVSQALVFGMAALPLSLTISRFTNGLTRPIFGWISDRIGRELTMVIAFTLEAISILALLGLRNDPIAFVILTGVVFFGWGEIFSLFPSILTDTFGTKHATTNYGFLYISQGIGSLLGGPASAYLESITGSWIPVFYLVAGADILTALLAILVLRPLRTKMAHEAQSGPIIKNTITSQHI